jgi:hypothetical protein
MPTQTRSSGRFSRPGTTQSRSSSSRFARGSAGTPGTSRTSRTSRTGGRVSRPMPNIGRRRSQPEPSGPKKALKAVGGLLPTAAAGKASKKTAKAGKAPLGLALVAGAGALAFSQRDKIQAKLRGGDGEHAETPLTATTTPDTATVTPASEPITPTTPPTTGL